MNKVIQIVGRVIVGLLVGLFALAAFASWRQPDVGPVIVRYSSSPEAELKFSCQLDAGPIYRARVKELFYEKCPDQARQSTEPAEVRGIFVYGRQREEWIGTWEGGMLLELNRVSSFEIE